MTAYKSVACECVTEKIIEKSRFITYVAHVAGEEEARSYLAKLHKLHPLATHICYGYVADSVGNLQRFSDDGEPQGTAGLPILNVLKTRKLCETIVAVVRYFGGIKLGAGGLVRAYASSAAEGCEAAQTRSFEPCVELSVKAEYTEVNALTRFLAGYEVLGRTFEQQAEFTVAVRAEEEQAFREKLTDLVHGRVVIAERKRYCYAFALRNE